jgi:hypothetical protein
MALTDREAARAAWRRKVRGELRKADDEFKGKYADELQGLLGLSADEIARITPGDVDLEAYHQLITVVRSASANNAAAADLRAQIQDLGATAVRIAKKVVGLARLLA